VPFVRRQYPQDTQRQVESHHLKLDALCSMFERLQPRQKREYGVTANVLLSLIDRMKVDARPLSVRYFQLEADATIPMVGLLLMRGQKRVQGGR